MGRRSDKNPIKTLARSFDAKGPKLDFVIYDCEGEDPRPRVELPEGVEVANIAAADVDAIGACYDVDGEEGEHVAIMVIAVKARTPELAMGNLVAGIKQVASELFEEVANGDE